MRNEPLFLELLRVVASFGLGVGLALGFAVRASPLLRLPLTVVARSDELLFDDLTVVPGFWGLGVGVADNAFALARCWPSG
jgi:hypothetical protein